MRQLTLFEVRSNFEVVKSGTSFHVDKGFARLFLVASPAGQAPPVLDSFDRQAELVDDVAFHLPLAHVELGFAMYCR